MSGFSGSPSGVMELFEEVEYTTPSILNGAVWTIDHSLHPDPTIGRMVEIWYTPWDLDTSLDFDAVDAGNFTIQNTIYQTMANDAIALKELDRDLHLHFEDGVGAVVTDVSGNAHHGACINMEDADWLTGGSQKVGNFCLSFSGGNEYVNFGNICNYDYTNDFTIEGWYYGASGIAQPFFCKQKDNGAGGIQGWMLYMNASRAPIFQARNDNGAVARYNSWLFSTQVPQNQWCYLFFQHTGNADSQLVTVNLSVKYPGVGFFTAGKTMSTAGGGLVGNTMASDANLTIGARVSAVAPLYGTFRIDESILYPNAITTGIGNARSASDVGSASETNYLPSNVMHCHTTVLNQINTAGWEAIKGVTITDTVPAGCHALYLFSFNGGVSWYYWNTSAGGFWDNSSIAAIKAVYALVGGKTEIEAQDRTSWDTIFVAGTLDVCVLQRTDSIDATPVTDQITFNAELWGQQQATDEFKVVATASTTTTVENISGKEQLGVVAKFII